MKLARTDRHSTFILSDCYFSWISKPFLENKKSFSWLGHYFHHLSLKICQSIPCMYSYNKHLLKVMFVKKKKKEALSWLFFPKQILEILRINYCMLLQMIAVIYFTWKQDPSCLVNLIKISRWLNYTILKNQVYKNKMDK